MDIFRFWAQESTPFQADFQKIVREGVVVLLSSIGHGRLSKNSGTFRSV